MEAVPSGGTEEICGNGLLGKLSVALIARILVLAKFSVQELCRGACICKRFKAACYDSLLWNSIVVDGLAGSNIYGAGLEAVSKRCKHLEELVLLNIDIKERPNPWMHYGFEQLLLQCGTKLRKCRIQFVCQLPFTDLLIKTIGRLCPNLEDFELSARDYYATDVAVEKFVHDCPRVRHFRCFVREPFPIHALGDSICRSISELWPTLLSLEVNGHHVSEDGFRALTKCSHLNFLRLHGYKRNSFVKAMADGDAGPFSSLTVISFAHTLPSVEELHQVLQMCPVLTTLEFQLPAGHPGMQEEAALLTTAAINYSLRLEVTSVPLYLPAGKPREASRGVRIPDNLQSLPMDNPAPVVVSFSFQTGAGGSAPVSPKFPSKPSSNFWA